eukprot:jgi/Galph1/4157/GphlegSOOS_G2836.1
MASSWHLWKLALVKYGTESFFKAGGNRSVVNGTIPLLSLSSLLTFSSCKSRAFSAVPREEKSNNNKQTKAAESDKTENNVPQTLRDSYGFELRPSAPDRMPDAFDQATGSERAELEDPDIYRNPEKYVNSRVMIAPFGSKEKPLLIPSRYDARLIGCTGRKAPNDHEIYYMTVKEKNDKVCPLCGQVFRLKRVGSGEADHHDHH